MGDSAEPRADEPDVPEPERASEPEPEPKPEPRQDDQPERPRPAASEEALSDDTDSSGSFRDRMAADDRERELRSRSLRGLTSNRTRIDGRFNSVLNAGGDINVRSDQKGRAQSPRVSMGEAHALLNCATGVDAVVERVVEVLRRHRIALVRGPSGSGRTATATLALLHADAGERARVEAAKEYRDQPANVARLLLRDDPLELSCEDLDGGIGYVLDATDESWPRRSAASASVVAHLADLAVRTDGRIVVVVGESCQPDDRTIDQAMPDAEEVFARRLEYLLHAVRDPRAWVDKIRTSPELKAALGESPTPRIAVDTAYEVFQVHEQHGPEKGIDAYLSGLPALVLTEMHGKLHDDDPATLRKRCFAIAAAVLNTLPAVTVSRAALALAALVEKTDQEEIPAAVLAWEQLTEWLTFAGATASPSTRGEGRIVRLKRPTQAHATLEAVWEEHPTVREPLIVWLRWLSEHTDQAVRIRTAHAVGTLATFDFDVIERDFLLPWARARSIRKHQLAAWVLEAAATQDGIADRVRVLLRRWAGGSRTQQSVAARAYGSEIGMLWVDDTLNAFETISKVIRLPPLQDAVARSIADLFGEGRETEILHKLHAWSDDDFPSQRRTAALAFNRLINRLRSQDGRTGMVELLDGCDPSLHRLLIGLWWNALSGGVTLTHRRSLRGAADNAAWDIIADWLRSEAVYPVLGPVIDGVFRLDEEHSDLRGPLSLHLRLWFHRNPKIIGSERAERLARILEQN
ncbi:hypothetical protein AGRA3207_004572 [Actinomadura graeca]|uniref:ATP-binding protein n=1 Tax=Actinomadura graeca TaxID=2750812 RepID=A0ABX8QZI7_9ACTN|nr:hypothetical protein [Actinomadura graeca]QXJ23424.1 hypothetical protein AGRA3207_004572 [Actinomadura graeca]